MALENGNEYQSDIVVSNMTLPRTFLECMDTKDLDPEFHPQGEKLQDSWLIRQGQLGPGWLCPNLPP